MPHRSTDLTAPDTSLILLVFTSLSVEQRRMHRQASSGFSGLGTSHMYAQLLMDAVEACASVVRTVVPRESPSLSGGPGLVVALRELRSVLVRHGYAPGTAARYSSHVFRFLRTVGPRTPEQLTHDDVKRYLQALRMTGKSNGTLRVQLCALRAVFDRLLGMRITDGIAHAPRPAPIPPARAEEVEAIMVASRRDPRDRMVVDMLNRAKLRQGTLRLLRVTEGASCLFAGGDWRAAEAKRTAPSIVPLVIAKDESACTGWLLTSSRRHAPISTRTIRRIVERRAAACGIRTTCTAIRKAVVVPIRAVA